MGQLVLNGIVGLLLAGSFLFPYIGGAVTAYVLIGLCLLLVIWALLRAQRVQSDPGAWMFLLAWVLLALAYALTNRPGTLDMLSAFNFVLFALFPLLHAALQRFAEPGNLAKVAVLSLAGTIVAFLVALAQVTIGHFDRAEGFASNPIKAGTVALFLGFFSLAGFFAPSLRRWRYGFLIGPVLGIAVVLMAGSRGPLLALPALVLVALILLPIRRAVSIGAVAAVILVAGGAYLVKPALFGRIQTLPAMLSDLVTGHPITEATDGSGNVRYAILVGSIAAFERSPWLGYGWYMKAPVVARYTPINVGFGDPKTAHLHSDILNFGVSAGIVGLVAYLLAIFAPIASAATSPRDSQFAGRLFLSLGLSLGYLSCGVVNLLFGFEFLTTLYVCWAMLFLGYCRDRSVAEGGPA